MTVPQSAASNAASPVRLNLGCGACVVDGWINVDYALGARLAKAPGFKLANSRLRLFNMDWDPRIVLHDLTRPFPWTAGSVQAIYSSHTLEHMSREQGAEFMRQCHRVLRRGGVLRIVVPDLHDIVTRYVRGELPADFFVEELGVLYEQRGGDLKSRLAPMLQYPHKCMYDQKALLALFARTGFAARKCSAFESQIEGIAQIEVESRTVRAVIVEGFRI